MAPPVEAKRAWPHAAPAGCFQQVQRALNVDIGVERRVGHGAPYVHLRGLVYEHVESAFGDDARRLLATYVHLVERCAFWHVLGASGGQVVEDRDLVAVGEERLRQVGPDEACAARQADVSGGAGRFGRCRQGLIGHLDSGSLRVGGAKPSGALTPVGVETLPVLGRLNQLGRLAPGYWPCRRWEDAYRIRIRRRTSTSMRISERPSCCGKNRL